jgi:hypothetical protein
MLAFLSAICAAPAFAQEDESIVRAVMNRLHEMQSREGVSHGFVIHEGFFSLSRHRLDRSLDEPVREWTEAEKEGLLSTAKTRNTPVRLCRAACADRTDAEWSVALGIPDHIDSERAVVPVQIAGSGRDGTSSWRTAHEFSLARDSLGSWVVDEVFYGVSSDAVSCYELYGHSCEEELKMFQSKPDTLPGSADDDDYAGEVVGALIGGVVSWYGLSILAGVGASWVAIIPGALIGMGIGSKF